MEGKTLNICCSYFFIEKGGSDNMENMIYVGINAQNQVEYSRVENKKTEDRHTGRPKGFLEHVAERAGTKSPSEMTLVEYRQYLKEKIGRSVRLICGERFPCSVGFSDMALVMMKSDPELEEAVLKGVLKELGKEAEAKRDKHIYMDVQVRHARENKAEQKKDQQRRLLRKKMLEIWFEKRAEQRENYSEFLKTGRRYATPCPAVEMLKAVRSMGSFLGL